MCCGELEQDLRIRRSVLEVAFTGGRRGKKLLIMITDFSEGSKIG
jgi:hypothetical protein